MAFSFRPLTQAEREQLFTQALLNNTDKVSKISDHSVLYGIIRGAAKTIQKADYDVAMALGQLFPEFGSGINLDRLAEVYGLPPRATSAGSSVYIKLVASAGTTYQQGQHVFVSTTGQRFTLTTASVTIPAQEYTYVLLNSLDTGDITNVNPLTITKLLSPPTGHRYCVNEASAVGGRDNEPDSAFRQRLKNGLAISSRSTLEQLCEAIRVFLPEVLLLYNYGITTAGKLRLGLATQTGRQLNSQQLLTLTTNISGSLALIDQLPYLNGAAGVELVNAQFWPVDVSIRLELDGTKTVDEVRFFMQADIQRFLDWRKWPAEAKKLDWDDLLGLAKATKGVKYVADEWFFPRQDQIVPRGYLPRLRGFQLLSLAGGLLVDLQGQLQPIYYPAQADYLYQALYLRDI